MKWFISMGIAPLCGFIWGIYEIKKEGKNIQRIQDLNPQERKIYIFNMIFVIIALMSMLSGIYKNHKFADDCIKEGIYGKGEIVHWLEVQSIG